VPSILTDFNQICSFLRDSHKVIQHQISRKSIQLKCDGTRRRMGGEVKGKLANAVKPVPFTLPRNMVYPALLPLLPLMRTPRLPVVDWTDNPADLNGLVHFAERRNLVSARVPSHFNWPLHADRWNDGRKCRSQLSLATTTRMRLKTSRILWQTRSAFKTLSVKEAAGHVVTSLSVCRSH